jgi:hypothetical protein
VTPTSTPTLPNPCSSVPNSQNLPKLNNNSGYWCTIHLGTTGFIVASWFDNNDTNNTVNVYANIPSAFGSADPNTTTPGQLSGNLAVQLRGTYVFAVTSCLQPGTYTVYFWNQGSAFPSSSAGVTAFPTSTCGTG